jgi:hypothetical protein
MRPVGRRHRSDRFDQDRQAAAEMPAPFAGWAVSTRNGEIVPSPKPVFNRENSVAFAMDRELSQI